MNGRSFTEYKKELGIEEFARMCKKIAKEYANSDLQYSTSYFSEKYSITRASFKKIIREAIITNLVSMEEIQKIQRKSIENQQNHAKTSGNKTRQYYAQLKEEREKYILEKYPEEKIKILAEDFANNPDMNLERFAKKYDMEIMTFCKLLKKAFVNKIVDDEICKKIEKRSKAKDRSKKTENFFIKLWKEREEALK